MSTAARVLPALVVITAGCTVAGAGSPATEVEPTSVVSSAPVDRSALEVDPELARPIIAPDAPNLGVVAMRTDGSLVRVLGGVAADESPSSDRLLSLDRSTVVETTSAGAGTRVSWRDTFTGADLGQTDVATGDLDAAASNEDGTFVALVNRGSPPGDDQIADGRRSSTIVLVDAEGGERRRFELPGNFVPEVIGPKVGTELPSTIFVLEYTPPAAPTHYRVRLLDTDSGELGLPFSLQNRYSQVDARMAGLSRTQAFAVRQQFLFTLYRGVAGEGGRHGYAFVHTLGLDGGVWCLDVAPEMDLDAQEGALAASGGHLVVASANGFIGSFDLTSIAAMGNPEDSAPVMEGVRQLAHSGSGAAPALATLGDHVWVAWGRHVYQLDAATLELVGSGPYVSDRPVTAIVVADGTVLLAHPDGTITSSSGAEIRLPDRVRTVDAEISRLLAR